MEMDYKGDPMYWYVEITYVKKDKKDPNRIDPLLDRILDDYIKSVGGEREGDEVGMDREGTVRNLHYRFLEEPDNNVMARLRQIGRDYKDVSFDPYDYGLEDAVIKYQDDYD